jgi:hypothetical protein
LVEHYLFGGHFANPYVSSSRVVQAQVMAGMRASRAQGSDRATLSLLVVEMHGKSLDFDILDTGMYNCTV